jgi:hypothetical protein
MHPRVVLGLSSALSLAGPSTASGLEPVSAAAAAPAPAPTPLEAPASSEALVSASLLGVHGVSGKFEDSNVNRFGWGFGARVGVSLERPGIYLGGSFVRFLGGEDDSGEYYTTTLNVEAGYDVMLADGQLFIRPMLALGVAQLATIQSDNAGYPLALHGAPALLVGARLLSPLLLSFEVRNDVVAGSWSNALTFALGAGAEF